MTFATPLGLLALLAIPAIVLIHTLRRRFPARRVAGLFLWQSARQTPEGGGRIARLPITASLLLECLAALALALILAGARWSPAAVNAHLVVLLDDSASMAAVNDRGQSARDRATERALEELARLGDRARVTLVVSGDRPSVLLGPAALAAEAPAALETWQPAAPHHSLALGIRLARELAGRTGRLIVMSDAPPAPRADGGFDGGLWVSLGEAPRNVGITAAQRTIGSGSSQAAVALTLTNHSAAAARRQMRVSSSPGEDVAVRQLELPSGSSWISIPIPAGTGAVRVALDNDALARDNEVILAEPKSRIVAVENQLPEGRGRQALARALEALAGVTSAAPGHLAFAGAEALDRPSPGGGWRVGFGRPPAAWAGGGSAKDFIGPFIIEKRHPLMLGLTLGGVVWTGAVPMRPDAVRPLMAAGDHPLVALATGSAAASAPSIFINLDLDRSNLIRAPDWPILISNLVEMRRQALPGPERWNYRAGEWIRVRLARDPAAPLRFRCGSIERSLPGVRNLEFMAPAACGLLHVLEGEQVLFELGVNFLDEVETDLRTQATGESGRITDVPGLRTETGAVSDPLFWILLAVAGTAILSNWWLLSPAPRRA